MEKKRMKRYLSLLLVFVMTVTSFGTVGVTANAATASLTLHYASSNSTGVISELKEGYNHGRVMYGIIDGEAAYCMNYGKSADGGQSMESTDMQTALSQSQQEQLLYCMYYGHGRTSNEAPDNTAKNEFVATQAMVWIIEADLFGTAAGDSAAVKICNSAPDPAASNAYYATLKANMSAAINQSVPSFSSRVAYTADTIELEWNESNNRYEKTITDSNKVLSNFNLTISGVNYTVDGNKITFYTSNVITSAQTGNFKSTNGSVEITGNCIYWNVASSSYQEFVSTKPSGDPVNAYVKIKTEEMGYGDLYKKDESTGTLLADAVFGIYTDKACTDLVEKITTNNKGYAKSSPLVAGTYYLKEIKAPARYRLNGTAYKLVVEAGKTTTVTATNTEQKGKITIYKEGEVLKSWNGISFVYETRKLPGATFKITAVENIYSADGTKKYSAGDLVAGNKKTGSDGSVTVSDLYLGKYTVTETASISGYTINTTSKTVTLSYGGQEAEVVSQSTTITNSRQKAEVQIVKKDSDTKNGLIGGQYGLYAGNDIKNYDGTVIVAKGTLLETAATGTDGKAAYVLDLPIGNQFYIKETKAPNLYYRNLTDTDTFHFTAIEETKAKAEFSYTFENDWVPTTIALQKVDRELNTNVPQGDASLEGAAYGLYAAEDISHPDGRTGLQHKKDSLVATLMTDSKGKASVSGLFLGKYYVKELIPSEGYLLDETVYEVDCGYEGDLVKVVSRSMISKEQVKKQPFQLIKAANNGETDAPLLEGAGFTAYLVSSLSVNPDGTYDFSSAEPVIIGENGATELFTNSTGYAVSIPIPYGTYIVCETTVPHNYKPVADFYVKVTEHKPAEPQVWRILLDEEFQAKLRIIKLDSKTGKAVLVPSAEFKLFNLDTQEYVVQYTTYPTKVKHTSFFTDEDGDLILPETLKVGNYRIEEMSAPDGYVVNEIYITVAVDSDTMYQVDPDTNDVIITAEYENNSAVGELTVEKKGEVLKDYSGGLFDFFTSSDDKDFIYKVAALSGAEFKVYAAEDIYTNDYQTDEFGERTKYYSEGDLVGVLTTGENGKAALKDIPLGNYKIVETKAPDGYVLNEEEQTVSFVYVDDKTPVIYESNSFMNERQKVSVSVSKLDEETGLPIEGAVFGLYTAEDIKNIDGNVIVEADTLLEQAVSGEDGLLIFTKDLPFGKYYAKEIQAPDGYVSSDSILEFDFSYQGQGMAVVELSAEFENTPTTVSFTKTDITSEAELSGATLTVLDEAGNIIETWVSEAENPHVIKNLHVGKTYTLREEFAPYGYLKATDISFTISDTGEVQTVEMKDEVSTGTIIVNKDGEFLTDINLVKGHWYDFIFDYFREKLCGVTFEIYAAEDILSPDGLDTVYYEKDQFVLEIVTDEKGYAIADNLPLGKYYLVETQTLEGFVLDSTPIPADVSYIDQYTEIVYAGMDVENIRQKVKIDIIKKDAETGETLQGAVFGLYVAEEIRTRDGKLLAEKDTLVERAVTGEEGSCTFVSDMPLGHYYVVEEEAPLGYAATDRAFEVDATYQGNDMAVIEYTAEFENHPTKVEISKKDITGKEEVPGAELIILDEAGNEVERWTSGWEPHLIERLPVGKYTLRERIAPYGYVIATDVVFEVQDTAELQMVEMKDDITKGKIVIYKTDGETKEPLAGVTFEISDNTGEVLEVVTTDENGYAESKEYAIGSYQDGLFVDLYWFTVKEIETAPGYVLEEVSYEMALPWQDGTIPVVEAVIELENSPTKVEISKTDITGEEEIPGAELTVLDMDGNVIEQWVSSRKPHLIERLPIGEYILREEIAPEGYMIATDMKFTVKETDEIQKVKMKDDTTKGKIIIYKTDDSTKQPLAGVKFEICSEAGEVMETLVTDENGYAESKLYAIGTYEKGKLEEPLKYIIVETKTNEGYILDETPQEVIFEWKDGKTEVIEVELNLSNKPTEPKLPQTGDDMKPWMFAGIGLIFVAGGIHVSRKKRKSE